MKIDVKNAGIILMDYKIALARHTTWRICHFWQIIDINKSRKKL